MQTDNIKLLNYVNRINATDYTHKDSGATIIRSHYKCIKIRPENMQSDDLIFSEKCEYEILLI